MSIDTSAYITIEEGKRHAIILSAVAAPLGAALLRGEALQPFAAEGRGEVARFALEDDWGVLRRFYRGGLPGHFLRDSYLFDNRPLSEFRIHLDLFRKGISCPEPLGVVWQRWGPCYRGAIATRFIDGTSLHALLSGGAGDTPLDEAIFASGKAIRALHEAGGLHADLHPGNLLVARGQAFLIDFDRARLLADLTPRQIASNLRRLRRAFVKHGFDMKYYDLLMTGYDSACPEG